MRKVVYILFLFYILFICAICYKGFFEKKKTIFSQIINITKSNENFGKQKYTKCLNEPYASSNLNDEFSKAFENLKSKGVAIYLEDINNEYSWEMNSDKVYYSASTSKLFDVIYLIEQARNNKIDLNSTLTYSPNYARTSSKGLENHSFYEEITILKLIEYVLTYSDNAAHAMLIDYIGVDTLKEYFSDFNLQIYKSDPYVSNYTTTIAQNSLKRVYKLWGIDDEYTTLIKNSMNNSNLNYLKYDNKVFYHKYGLYNANFHDIGIYDDKEYPYIVVILTQYGNLGKSIYGPMVQDISKKIYEIYENNLKEKEAYCEQAKSNL